MFKFPSSLKGTCHTRVELPRLHYGLNVTNYTCKDFIPQKVALTGTEV